MGQSEIERERERAKRSVVNIGWKMMYNIADEGKNSGKIPTKKSQTNNRCEYTLFERGNNHGLGEKTHKLNLKLVQFNYELR